MNKLKDLISEGPKTRAGDYVRDKRTKELGKVNKIKGNRMAYVKFPSNKKSFLPMDVSKWKPSGKQNVGRTIWTEGKLTEGKETLVATGKDKKGKKIQMYKTVRWGGMVTYILKSNGKEFDQYAPNLKDKAALNKFKKDYKNIKIEK